jgi:hypothetical protein
MTGLADVAAVPDEVEADWAAVSGSAGPTGRPEVGSRRRRRPVVTGSGASGRVGLSDEAAAGMTGAIDDVQGGPAGGGSGWAGVSGRVEGDPAAAAAAAVEGVTA